MRKLKLQVQMTIDGFMAGPNGEMDWVTFNWTDDINEYVRELTDPVDGIVMGRKLAEGFIPYWGGIAANPEDPQHAAGKKFTETPKVVFTKTLTDSSWPHTTLAKGDLATEINQLKTESGGDLIAYGGATFVSSLIREGLVDEFFLFVNPTAIGKGLPIFASINEKQNLQLVHSQAFDCGIVLLRYVKGTA